MRASAFYCLLFHLLCNSIFAQEILSSKDAVAIALENNFDILISKNEAKIGTVNANLGNAGILPTLDANFIRNNSIQNTSQTQQSGEVRELNNAKNNSMNYGVSLGWTVFDGLGMFARYDQLKQIQNQTETQLRLSVLTKTSEVLSAYYGLVQNQILLKALDTTIVISEQRLKTAENRFKIGKASKLEVLNAKVDLNADLSRLAKQKEILQIGKIKLNELMARDLNTEFGVEEVTEYNETMRLDNLISESEKQNPQLQLALINQEITESESRKVKANRYPVIRLNSGYNFSETESSLGFVSQSSGKGFNYGVSATFNVFNGFQQNTNEKAAKIALENSKLEVDKEKQTLKSNLMAVFQNYLTNIELAKLESQNEIIAKQNLEITMEKFRIGTLTPLEFRTAQENYVNAVARNNNAKFQAKISEVLLQQLSGSIKI